MDTIPLPNRDEYFLGQFIPAHYHFAMLQDQLRMEAFSRAIQWSVQPGSRVVELGGGTGVLSHWAAQRGARVWCVERLPGLVQTARSLLSANQADARVTVVQADAMDYLPPEPVDVVICEMLHVALVREQQVAVLRSFRERHRRKFGVEPHTLLPEASLLGVQPVEQDFTFFGYHAAVPVFQQPGLPHERTQPLGEPVLYHSIQYGGALPDDLSWSGDLTFNRDGQLNALRFITQNVLAVDVQTTELVEWSNQYLVLPLPRSLAVGAGETVALSFTYRAGDPLDRLAQSLTIAESRQAYPARRVA